MNKKHLIIAIITVLILNITAGVIFTLLELPVGERWALNLICGALIGHIYAKGYFYYLERKETRYFKFIVDGKIANVHATRSRALIDLFVGWSMEGISSIEISRKEYKELMKNDKVQT